MKPPSIRLSELMIVGRPSELPVSVSAHQVHPWEELLRRVAGLVRILDGAHTRRWALYSENAWAFAVGLLGIWQAGGVAVLPPNGRPGTLKEVAADVSGIVTDRPEQILGVDAIPALGFSDATPRAWSRLGGGPALELYTSGTTGARRIVAKSVGDLDDEVAAHEARWGHLLADTQAVATVSHQHIYGLLFRILWPLIAGRPFRDDTPLQPTEVAAALERSAPAFLVSTPAHLRRLAASRETMAGPLARCPIVFCSGGALDHATARELAALAGAAPIEIFGSTETGGVAWRRQSALEPGRWTPFEGVHAVAAEDGRLRIVSPWTGDARRPIVMGDRATVLADGTFELGARADRIVKIGEKRVALPDMEARLLEHGFVKAAAVVAVPRGVDARLGAAIVPSEEGTTTLGREGKHRLADSLRRWLAEHWDVVLLPRVWRFVDALPEDPQGKTSTAAVLQLFERPGAP